LDCARTTVLIRIADKQTKRTDFMKPSEDVRFDLRSNSAEV